MELQKTVLFFSFLIISLSAAFVLKSIDFNKDMDGAPPGGATRAETANLDPYAWIRNWTRPGGPAKVAIQVGHWKNQEVPEELENLRQNTGASSSGVTELEINLDVSERIFNILRENNIDVEILPTTVPPRYWADVFIAIHADGSTDHRTSGYKFAGPWRDFTGNSDKLVEILSENYERDTDLEFDDNISRNMRGYYAFSWWRYEHAIHPMTTAVIAELGFVTNRSDRNLLTTKSDLVAESISKSILKYLESEELL